MLLGLGFHIEIKKEIFRNFLVPKLPKYFKLRPFRGNCPYVFGIGFQIEIKMEIFKNLLVLSPQS